MEKKVDLWVVTDRTDSKMNMTEENGKTDLIPGIVREDVMDYDVVAGMTGLM